MLATRVVEHRAIGVEIDEERQVLRKHPPGPNHG
jgi:hypothetical protein